MSYETIIVTIEDDIGIINLNRPEVMNALSSKVFNELSEAALSLAQNQSVRVIIITGGEKVFAAGADINEMVNLNSTEVAIDGRPSGPTYNILEKIPKPLIAAVGGYALGGGCELSLVADIRIAGENAIFGLPEIKLGIIPGGGGTQRLPRLIGTAKAKELIFSGDFIDAKEALRIGLVNKVVPVEKLLDEAKSLAKRFSRWGPVALNMAKTAINDGNKMNIQAGLQYEHKCLSLLFSTQDQKEGMKAFLEKRMANFIGR